MPKGVYVRTPENEEKRRLAIKAHLPRTTFKKGVNSYPDMKFQKGYTPFNKGKQGLQGHSGAPKGTAPWNKGIKMKKGDDTHATNTQ